MSNKLNIFFLLIKSIFIKIYYSFNKFPSNDIDTFIRLFFIKNIGRLNIKDIVYHQINPLSSIRYFEFDFVRKNIVLNNKFKILDVSSPRFLGLYLCSKFPEIKYTMINPDKKDVIQIEKYRRLMKIPNFKLINNYIEKINCNNASFNTIISVSVIEHIDYPIDTIAIRKMWDLLKPGGQLLVTTHISDRLKIEYRKGEQYNLNSQKNKKIVFFQRIYDFQALKKRVFDVIGKFPDNYELIEESKKGFFEEYISKCIKNQLMETVNDPLYIISKFKKVSDIKKVRNLGVIAMLFKKDR